MTNVEEPELDKKVCSVEGCTLSSKKLGMCLRHYHAEWRRTTTAPVPHGTLTAYNSRGCRCNLCKTVMSGHKKQQRLDKLAEADEQSA